MKISEKQQKMNVKKRTYYQEAIRYIDKAKDLLKKSPKEGNYYTDIKYVKSAGRNAFVGIEKAAKWLIELNGIEIQKDADVWEIKKALTKINSGSYIPYLWFNDFYTYFYLTVYLRGHNNARMINVTLKDAKIFISFLKQYNETAVYKKGATTKKKNNTIK